MAVKMTGEEIEDQKPKKTNHFPFLIPSILSNGELFSPLLIISFVFLSIVISSNADSRTDLIARTCQRNSVKDAKKYNESYTRALRDMQDDLPWLNFAVGAAGSSPQRLYLIAQCYNDLTPEDCKVCFDYAKKLLPSCFPATGGRVYTDGCFMRADNYSFYDETTSSADISRCSDSINESTDFKKTAWKAIKAVIERAVMEDGYAHMRESINGESVYAMASCWRPLRKTACTTCLADAAQAAMSCLPSTEGRVLNAGCIIRYSDYEFSNRPDMEPSDSVFIYMAFILGALAICAAVILVGFCAGKIIYRRNRRKVDGTEVEMSVLSRNFQILQFKYTTLEQATECFNEAHKLGQGGFGEVFKGTLPDGREIAIKRLFLSGKAETEEVCNEIDIICGAQHKNLVRLLGCCFTVSNSFLVYEFLQKKSLDSILFDTKMKQELDWKKRLAIIMGTAEGLEYLHNECHVRIIHRDIKASNILLDVKYKPKIADFGLARFSSLDTNLVGVAIAGTFGYMAPEYLAQGRLTEKVDVYSFGVLMIEIVTGERNNKTNAGDIYDTIINRVWNHYQSNTLADIIDESMEKSEIEEVKRVLKVGLLCIQEKPASRPTMMRVIQFLTTDIELPEPSKPPFTDESMELPLGSNPNPPSLNLRSQSLELSEVEN